MSLKCDALYLKVLTRAFLSPALRPSLYPTLLLIILRSQLNNRRGNIFVLYSRLLLHELTFF